MQRLPSQKEYCPERPECAKGSIKGEILPSRGYFGNLLVAFVLEKILFLERGEVREKERERNITVWLPLAYPQPGTWSATQACALTGNQTGDLLVLWGSLAGVQSTESYQPSLFFFNCQN